MEDRKLTEKESLEVITSMIARTKDRYLGNGNILLMWGYLVVAVSILVWVLISATHREYWNWLWFAIPLIGCIATPIMARRQQLRGDVTTYSDKITARLWNIFGISEIVLSLCCLAFAIIGDVNCWSAMLVYTLIAAPAAEIAQGLIVRESSLTGGGIVGLAVGLATVCCVTAGIPLYAYWFMPLFILAFTAMMIVPGHIINYKAKH